MITALVSKPFVAAFGDAVKLLAERAGKPVAFMMPPEEQGARLSQADCDRIDCTFIDRDIRFNEHIYAAYTDAAMAAKNAKWIHLTSSGVTPTRSLPR